LSNQALAARGTSPHLFAPGQRLQTLGMIERQVALLSASG
jgi:hypothetical protein